LGARRKTKEFLQGDHRDMLRICLRYFKMPF
jgi:hypothetical protein